jgi:hypothetical protein
VNLPQILEHVRMMKEARANSTPGEWAVDGSSEYRIQTKEGWNTIAQLGGNSGLVRNGDFICLAANNTAKWAEAIEVLSEALVWIRKDIALSIGKEDAIVSKCDETLNSVTEILGAK